MILNNGVIGHHQNFDNIEYSRFLLGDIYLINRNNKLIQNDQIQEERAPSRGEL